MTAHADMCMRNTPQIIDGKAEGGYTIIMAPRRSLLHKFRNLPIQHKTALYTTVGLCISAITAGIKFVTGLLTDYNQCTIAVYTVVLLLAKLQCVLGIASDRRTFRVRNGLISAFLLVSALIYTAFMCRQLFIPRSPSTGTLQSVCLLALVSFVELGMAIAGIVRTAQKDHYCRNIKIINFCIALMAILTTQTALLNFQGVSTAATYNSYTGMGIGLFAAACAVYILLAPSISVFGNEHQIFVLIRPDCNTAINVDCPTLCLPLLGSSVYGSYVYQATICNGVLDGRIQRTPSLWKRMSTPLKVLCCILSEILLFVWLFGRFILFLRSVNLHKRLQKTLQSQGFVKL